LQLGKRQEATMKTFDVQAIEIDAKAARVFEFVREPRNLPRWTQAFKSVDGDHALLETPNGAVDIRLETHANAPAGTVDWVMKFADGSVGNAESRVTGTTHGTSIYSFVLHAPPVPLEQLEGALDAQRVTLAKELVQLKSILEN
jgi:hypothetical protein